MAIGEAAKELETLFAGTGVFVSIAASMREAVAMAFDHARPGDVAPAVAGLRVPRHVHGYAERGRAFRELAGSESGEHVA